MGKKELHLSKIEWLCDDNFLKFLTEHWDFIKNPEEIVDLLVRNEDLIEKEDEPEELEHNTCGKYFFWEYDVNVEPFNYRCLYTRFDPPKMTLHTDLEDLWFNSYNNFGWNEIERMRPDIKANIKMTGSWSSSLK